MSTTSDLAFHERLRRAKAGDRAAIGELVEQYREPVESHIRRLLGRRRGSWLRSLHSTGDVLGSVLVEVLKELPKFEDRGPRAFVKWLCVKADGKLAHEHEKKRRRDARKRAIPLNTAADESLVVTGPGLATQVGEREELVVSQARLAQLLTKLTPKDREVVSLRVRELSFAEIAKRVGARTPGAVEKRYARALVRLRTLCGGTNSK